MYVSAMLNPLPMGSKGTWAAGYDFENPNTCAFIYASVVCPNDLHIPLLPYRYKGKLLFPKGCFDGVFYSAELYKAIQLGYTVDIHQCLIFPAKPFLADYAKDCWRIRQENPGKNPLNFTAKLFGNGIYGKFAQKREMSGLKVEHDFEAAASQGWTLVMPEYMLWRYPSYSNSAAILPYISAAITAYSRLTLYSYLEIEPEAVCYCDTDSVFIEGIELPSSPELGALKFENHHKRFIAIQPKFYYCEPNNKKPKLKAKGFTFKDTLPWGYDDFLYALDNNDYSNFEQMGEQKFSKLREAIKNLDLLMLVQRRRSVQSEYSKRTINLDYSTSPIDIQELEKLWFEKECEAYRIKCERLAKREFEKSRREFRKLILALGGIKPSRDYEIPRWCRRLNGQGIDEIVQELNSHGYMVTDAEEMFSLINNS
jgi:hypothetical protein